MKRLYFGIAHVHTYICRTHYTKSHTHIYTKKAMQNDEANHRQCWFYFAILFHIIAVVCTRFWSARLAPFFSKKACFISLMTHSVLERETKTEKSITNHPKDSMNWERDKERVQLEFVMVARSNKPANIPYSHLFRSLFFCFVWNDCTECVYNVCVFACLCVRMCLNRYESVDGHHVTRM